MSDTDRSGPDFAGSGAVEYTKPGSAGGGALEDLLAAEEARLLAIPGVTSVGIGNTGKPGERNLVVGVVDAGVASRLPAAIGGVPVTATVTGPVDALPLR